MSLWPENIPDDILAAMRPTTTDEFRKLYMQEFVPDDRGTGRTCKQLLRLRPRALFIVYDEREQMHVTQRLLHELRARHEDFIEPKVMTVYQFAERELFAGQRFEDFDVDHQVWERLSAGSYSREARFRDILHRFLEWAKIEDVALFKGEPPT